MGSVINDRQKKKLMSCGALGKQNKNKTIVTALGKKLKMKFWESSKVENSHEIEDEAAKFSWLNLYS